MSTSSDGPEQRTLLEFGLLVILGCTWGSSYMFNELALESMTSFTIAAARIVTGAIVLIVIAKLNGLRIFQSARAVAFMALIGFTGQAMPLGLMVHGQERIESGLTAIIIASVPIITLVLAHFLTRDDRITPRKAFGVGVGFVGMILLIGPEGLAGLTENFVGQLMILGTAIGFSITTVAARLARGFPPLAMAAGSLFFAGCYMLPLAFGFEEPLSLEPTLISLGAILALGLLSTAVAYIVFFRLSRTAPPNFVALNNYISPTVGVLWGVLLLSEALPVTAYLALLLIFLGIAINSWGGWLIAKLRARTA